jgi:hypothetical protein
MTSDTTAREHRSSDVILLAKLSRMLQSTLRRYPNARLTNTPGGFGVSLDGTTYVKVSSRGNLTDADMRDYLVLFATWLAADSGALRSGGTPLAGFIATGNGR